MALDLDKLKELLSKATPGPFRAEQRQLESVVLQAGGRQDGFANRVAQFPQWYPAPHPQPTSYDAYANAQLYAEVVNSLPALIAKAERVDLLERALGPFVSGSVVSVTDDESIPDHAMGGIKVMMGELRAARNALSPKPCTNCGCRDRSHAVAPQMREVFINCALCHAPSECGCPRPVEPIA